MRPVRKADFLLLHWNLNGWTATNCGLRKTILYYLNLDFVCLNETHLSFENTDLDGWTWFGRDRVAHRSALTSSFVPNSVFGWFYVQIGDK